MSLGWAVENIEQSRISRANAVFLDYLAQKPPILDFFSHGVTDYKATLASRSKLEFPKERLADLLLDYNHPLDPVIFLASNTVFIS